MNDLNDRGISGVSRRNFVSRMGAFGIGAVGATSLLAACGADNTTVGRQVGLSIGNTTIAQEFQNIKTDEDNHVLFLIAALGSAARPAPTFNTSLAVFQPQDVNTFIALSDALENTGTGAYTYATQFLVSDPATLVAAASIGLVEGRHAGFLNSLQNKPLLTDPANDTSPPNDFSREVPQPPSQVGQRAAPFLVGVNLNGGPGLPTDQLTPQSGLNQIQTVLNYALLLEYLEKTFYDINVPRFFGSGR